MVEFFILKIDRTNHIGHSHNCILSVCVKSEHNVTLRLTRFTENVVSIALEYRNA